MPAAEVLASRLVDDWETWLIDLLGDEDGVEFCASLVAEEIIWARDSEYHFDNWFSTG